LSRSAQSRSAGRTASCRRVAGELTARSCLIGNKTGNQRFRSPAAFALQCEADPIPCSSGQRTQDRLNRALHIFAVTRAQHGTTTRRYLTAKEAEGHTTKDALRCLTRHVARRVHHLVSLPALTPDDDHTTSEKIPPPHARHDNAAEMVGVAPVPVMCVYDLHMVDASIVSLHRAAALSLRRAIARASMTSLTRSQALQCRPFR
jgi:hypothetical protein